MFFTELRRPPDLTEFGHRDRAVLDEGLIQQGQLLESLADAPVDNLFLILSGLPASRRRPIPFRSPSRRSKIFPLDLIGA